MQDLEHDAISRSYLFKNLMYIKTEAAKKRLEGQLSEFDEKNIVTVTDLFAELVKLAPAFAPPPKKPLTRADIFQLIATGEYFVVHYEETEFSRTCAALWKGEKGTDETGCTFETDKLLWNDYGRTWRAWAARPTDEERAAAPWEE